MEDLPSINDTASINKRLDIIISIMMNPTKFQESSTKEKISHLASLDLTNNEIAKILNISSNFVSKEKSVLKKKGKNE